MQDTENAQLENPQLDLMRTLVRSGKTVRQAAKEVYGRTATFYEKTTGAERQTVFCRPAPAEGICRIDVAVTASHKRTLQAAAKAEGKTMQQFVKALIVERVTLIKSTNVLEQTQTLTATR